MSAGKNVVVCMYAAKEGQEAALEAVLATHWPTLHRLGLATEEPAQLLRGLDAPGGHGAKGRYLEIFSWKSADSMGLAHQSPEVQPIWKAIGDCCSKMDFPDFEHLR